jgi:hypothetical protein
MEYINNLLNNATMETDYQMMDAPLIAKFKKILNAKMF